MSQAQVVALFTTAKTQLGTVQTNTGTLQASLLALEQTRAALVAAGGSAAALWLQKQITNLSQGWTPLTVPGGPALLTVCAPDPAKPQDLTLACDLRPIAAYDPSLS